MQETARAEGIKSLPTFKFYKNGEKVIHLLMGMTLFASSLHPGLIYSSVGNGRMFNIMCVQ